MGGGGLGGSRWRASGSISWRGGIEPRRRHRMGSTGVTAAQEAAGTASRAGGTCVAGRGGAGGSRSSGGTGGGGWSGGPRWS